MKIPAANIQLVMIVAGAMLCLGGWVVFWLGTRLVGIALGLGFGFAFGELLSFALKADLATERVIWLSCSFLGAAGGLMFMRFVSNFLFILAGFIFGVMLGRVATEMYLHVHHQKFVLTPQIGGGLVICGAVVGMLTVWLKRFIVITITSYVGAAFLVGGANIRADQAVLWFAGILLGSIVWQSILVTQFLPSKKGSS